MAQSPKKSPKKKSPKKKGVAIKGPIYFISSSTWGRFYSRRPWMDLGCGLFSKVEPGSEFPKYLRSGHGYPKGHVLGTHLKGEDDYEPHNWMNVRKHPLHVGHNIVPMTYDVGGECPPRNFFREYPPTPPRPSPGSETPPPRKETKFLERPPGYVPKYPTGVTPFWTRASDRVASPRKRTPPKRGSSPPKKRRRSRSKSPERHVRFRD